MYKENSDKKISPIQIRPILFTVDKNNYAFYIPQSLEDVRIEPGKDDSRVSSPIGSIIIEMANIDIDKIKQVMSFKNVFFKNVKWNRHEGLKEYSDIEFLTYLFAEFSKLCSAHFSMLLVLLLLYEYNFDITKNNETASIIQYSTKTMYNPIANKLEAYKNICETHIETNENMANKDLLKSVLIAYPQILHDEYEIIYSVNEEWGGEPLMSILEFDMIHSYKQNIIFARCSCGNYFISRGNNKSFCLDCGSEGAKRKYYKKIISNPILKAYRNHIDKANKRMNLGKNKTITPENNAMLQEVSLKIKEEFIREYQVNPSDELVESFRNKLTTIMDKYSD